MASDKPTLIGDDTVKPMGTVSVTAVGIAVANAYIAANLFTVANATSMVNVNVSAVKK